MRIVAPIAKNTKNYIYIVFKPIIIQFYYNKNIFPRNRLLSSFQNIFFFVLVIDVVVVVAVVIIILILTLILQVYGWPFAGTSGGGGEWGGGTDRTTDINMDIDRTTDINMDIDRTTDINMDIATYILKTIED